MLWPHRARKNYLLIILAINLISHQHLYKTNKQQGRDLWDKTKHFGSLKAGEGSHQLQGVGPRKGWGFQWGNHRDPAPWKDNTFVSCHEKLRIKGKISRTQEQHTNLSGNGNITITFLLSYLPATKTPAKLMTHNSFLQTTWFF